MDYLIKPHILHILLSSEYVTKSDVFKVTVKASLAMFWKVSPHGKCSFSPMMSILSLRSRRRMRKAEMLRGTPSLGQSNSPLPLMISPGDWQTFRRYSPTFLLILRVPLGSPTSLRTYVFFYPPSAILGADRRHQIHPIARAVMVVLSFPYKVRGTY